VKKVTLEKKILKASDENPMQFNDLVSPAWFWLGDATVQLNQQLDTIGTDNEAKDVEDAKKELKKQEKVYKEMLDIEQEKTGNDTYEDVFKDVSGSIQLNLRSLVALIVRHMVCTFKISWKFYTDS